MLSRDPALFSFFILKQCAQKEVRGERQTEEAMNFWIQLVNHENAWSSRMFSFPFEHEHFKNATRLGLCSA